MLLPARGVLGGSGLEQRSEKVTLRASPPFGHRTAIGSLPRRAAGTLLQLGSAGLPGKYEKWDVGSCHRAVQVGWSGLMSLGCEGSPARTNAVLQEKVAGSSLGEAVHCSVWAALKLRLTVL